MAPRQRPASAVRRPGRPAAGAEAPDVRRRLVEAASRLFAHRGYGAVGIRTIAAEAGVNPAMIAYYFRTKRGLYEAVFDRVLDRLLARVRRMTDAAEREGDPITAFTRLYSETLAHDPWIPELLVREVLSREGPLRDRFRKRFAARAVQAFRALLARGIAEGRLRRDLDPDLALLSLVGMMAFPFLAQPVLGPLLGYTPDAAFATRLADHTARLFAVGTASGAAR